MENYSIEYGINQEATLQAFDFYNKVYGKTRIVTTVLFSVLSVLFIDQVIRDSSYTVGWICLAVCIAMAVMPWITKLAERKNVKEAVESLKEDRYVLILNPESFTIKTVPDEYEDEIPETVCSYQEQGLKLADKENYFGIFSKSRFFVIPKDSLTQEAEQAIKEAFSGVEKL